MGKREKDERDKTPEEPQPAPATPPGASFDTEEGRAAQHPGSRLAVRALHHGPIRTGGGVGAVIDAVQRRAGRGELAPQLGVNLVEPVFGQLKEDRGFTTLSLRGLLLARAEYLLACLAHNLGKLLRVCPLQPHPLGA